MSPRSAIPTAIRDRVLEEAGYRCAIPQCSQYPLEVHHIRAWREAAEHRYEDLIALCPTCHARADKGEIKASSLYRFKARGAALFNAPSLILQGAQPHERQVQKAGVNGWEMESLEEIRRHFPPFDVSLEYPRFNEQDEDLAQLNTLLKARALSELLGMRRLGINPGPPDEGWEGRPTAVSTVSESFWVACLTPELVSLRVSRFSYGAGAAHPNHTTTVLNFARRPLTQLDLEDILELGNGGLKRLGDKCRVLLGVLQQDEDDPDEDAVFISAYAQAATFHHFNLLPAGLLITFDPGSVGPMCEGTRQVLISPDRLQDLVRQHSPARGLWGLL